MRKLFLYLNLAFTCLSSITYGQDKLPEFGKIDRAELEMKDCPFAKGAPAMNLFSVANMTFYTSTFSEFPKIGTEYRTRIKIFDEQGFSAASINIPYSGKSHTTKISDIEAYIYNLDDSGNIVIQKVDKSQIFKEKSNAKNAYNRIRFTFPGLKKGSVIEYRYTKTISYSLSVSPWFFQDDIPTAYTSCKLTIPQYLAMSYHFITSQLVEKDSLLKEYANTLYNEDIRTFTMRNVPAFKHEPFMSSVVDNLQRVEFSMTRKTFFSYINAAAKWKLFNSLLLDFPFFGL